LIVENPEDFVAALPIEVSSRRRKLSASCAAGHSTVGAFTALGKDRVVERLGWMRWRCSIARPYRNSSLKLVTPPSHFRSMVLHWGRDARLLLFVLNRFVRRQRGSICWDLLWRADLRLKLASGKFYERIFQCCAPTSRAEISGC
jgi:hypothetical protein